MVDDSTIYNQDSNFPRRKIKSIIIKKERKKKKSHQNTWTLVGALVPGVGNTKYLLSRSKHDPECWLVNRSESRSKKRRMAIVQSVAERMRRKSFGGPTIDRQPDGECSLIDPISCVSRVRPNNKPASIAVNGMHRQRYLMVELMRWSIISSLIYSSNYSSLRK